MKVSFVIPCYKSEQTIGKVLDEIKITMSEAEKYSYEVILVNDSSPDKTFEVIEKLCSENDNIIGINMAKNFGQHAALMSGFHYATGDVVVCLDDDGQTPADEVTKLLDRIEQGADVVYASYGEKKHSLFRNFGSYINSMMAESLLGKPKDLYVSSYFAAKKYVIDEIIKYGNSYPYVVGLVLRTTNKIANVEVKHREREIGQSNYSIRKLLSLWVNGFTTFSVKPLRCAIYMGMLSAIVGFAYMIYLILARIFNPEILLGWTTIVAVVLFIGGEILFVLGIIGEYVGRTYISINSAPQYVVREVVGLKE